MENANLRDASVDDADKAAELLYISKDWIKEYLHLRNKEETIKLLKELFVTKDNTFSFTKTRLAEINGEIVGLLLSYPGKSSIKLSLKTVFRLYRIKGFSSILLVLKMFWDSLKFEKADKKEYYISSMAVDYDYRNLGIGEKLLSDAERLARRSNHKRCSLLVRVNNEPAKNLYYKFDYKIINVFKFNKFKICKMIKHFKL